MEKRYYHTNLQEVSPAFTNDSENFRPITLEPVIARVFPPLIRNRIYVYISKSNYIESHIQKGFWQSISGTVKHTELMSYLIDHAHNKQGSLVITLLYLRNAFEEVHHELRGLKNLLYNGAGAECNGATTFFSVKDSRVLRFFQSNKMGF